MESALFLVFDIVNSVVTSTLCVGYILCKHTHTHMETGREKMFPITTITIYPTLGLKNVFSLMILEKSPEMG